MLGKDEDENKKKPKHMSADDLNDGFILDKDDRRLLSYKVSSVPPPHLFKFKNYMVYSRDPLCI